jgi:hypothetical protein
MSQKSHDFFVAGICRKCHHWLDFGSEAKDPSGIWDCTRHDKEQMWTRAFEKTLLILWKNGWIGVL